MKLDLCPKNVVLSVSSNTGILNTNNDYDKYEQTAAVCVIAKGNQHGQ